MTMPAGAANPYLQTQVRASSPLELVVLLYDAALRSAAAAREAMVRRDIPARKAAVSRLLAIVAELQNTLDLERGGEIAQDLDRLYSWIMSRLMDAVVKQDVRPIDETTRVLETLRDGWRQIATAPPQPEARP